MQNTLMKAFNESAAAAHAAFPERLQNLVVLSDAMDTPVYVAPEAAEALSKNTEAVKKAIKQEAYELHRLFAAGLAMASRPIAGVDTKLIALMDKPPGDFTEKYTAEMRALFVLDHEIGHHVVETGRGKGRHLGEASADAFGLLRHVQRFGTETDYFTSGTRAGSMVLGTSPIHQTQAIYDRVAKVAKEMDLSKLSLQETAELAKTIATGEAYDGNTFYRVSKAYENAANIYLQQIGNPREIDDKLVADDAATRVLIASVTLAVMKQHANDRDVIKVGQQYLNGRRMKKWLTEQAEHNPFYKQVLEAASAPLPPPYVEPPKQKQEPLKAVYVRTIK